METENTYCHGFRYNFKKGTEICKNRDNCDLYKSYANHERQAHLDTIRFLSQKEYRKCDKYLTNKNSVKK